MKNVLLIYAIMVLMICKSGISHAGTTAAAASTQQPSEMQWSSAGIPSDPETLADSGISSYSRGEFAQALEYFLRIYHSGYSSPALLFNIGCAFFKTNNIPSAILFYERALQQAPRDMDIQLSLKIANTRIADKIELVPVFFLTAWFVSFRNLMSFEQWAITAVSGFALVFLCLLFFLFTEGRIRKMLLIFSLASIILTATSLLLAHSSYTFASSRSYAILMDAVVTARSSPTDSSTDLFVIHEGIKVKILGHVGDWSKIRLPDGNTGWVKTTAFEAI
jgi:tetratricopeptide (TPR) repeat protein